MTKLTDTQLTILSSAAQRHDYGVLLPERLKGQAARNTVERLISRGLVEEVRATPWSCLPALDVTLESSNIRAVLSKR
jgi:hypothetical protein